MIQDSPSRYREQTGHTVTIIAEASDREVVIAAALDGSRLNPGGGSATKQTFEFKMTGDVHNVVIQTLFDLSSDPQAKVEFNVTCDHGDSFPAGKKTRSSHYLRRNFTFERRP